MAKVIFLISAEVDEFLPYTFVILFFVGYDAKYCNTLYLYAVVLKYPFIINGSYDKVCGLTIIQDKLLVGCSNYIRQFDSVRYNLIQQTISNIEGLGSIEDITANTQHGGNQVFIADWVNEAIHVFDLKTCRKIRQWSVRGIPRGLSINKENNLVVTCSCDNSKLIEYSYDALSNKQKILRQIKLPEKSYAWHAVQLSDKNRFVVCHGESRCSPERVYVIECSGKLTKTIHRIDCISANAVNVARPIYLAVDNENHIFVADSNRNRIVVLNSSLEYLHEVNIDDSLLVRPTRILLDESRDLLYVGESDNGRVFVLKISECNTEVKRDVKEENNAQTSDLILSGHNSSLSHKAGTKDD